MKQCSRCSREITGKGKTGLCKSCGAHFRALKRGPALYLAPAKNRGRVSSRLHQHRSTVVTLPGGKVYDGKDHGLK